MNYNITDNLENNETERQIHFIEELKQYYKQISDKINRPIYFSIGTFGCQMNVRDSEKLSGMMDSIGLFKSDEENADIVIYNTCCVRENAENKVYGRLGNLKHRKNDNPYFKIILCGCMMQEEQVIDTLNKKYRYVDIIFGTFNLYKLPELLYTSINTKDTVIDIWKEHKDIVENIPSIRESKFKASINIMYGCDNFCTYCIVPYVRGRERSREVYDILEEIKLLAYDGVKEIMLLGQNVNSYGKTLKNPISFSNLLRQISDINGIKRIRFMTSHPKDLSDELIETMKDCNKICNHIHLPIQSGSTSILKKMNRKYTKDKYLLLVDKIKSSIPDISITTDIIVGFPEETDEDLQDTIDVINKVKFNNAFTFIYSKRTGTPASKIEDFSSKETIQKRFNKLLKIVNDNMYIKSYEQIGKIYDVLVEEQNDDGILSGRATNNSIVHFKGEHSLIGNIVSVKILDCKTFYLIGELTT